MTPAPQAPSIRCSSFIFWLFLLLLCALLGIQELFPTSASGAPTTFVDQSSSSSSSTESSGSSSSSSSGTRDESTEEVSTTITAPTRPTPTTPSTGSSSGSSTGTPVLQLPDLTVRKISLNIAKPRIDTKVKVTATIHNSGKKKVSKVIVRFTYQGKSRDKTISSIGGRKNGTITALITIHGTPGNHSIKVQVNPSKSIKESNYTNNSRKKTFQVLAEEPPDIFNLQPNSLIQGTTTTIKLRGKNLKHSARLDFGKCIRQIGHPPVSNTMQVKLHVDDDCPPTRYPIIIRMNRKKYTATAKIRVKAAPSVPLPDLTIKSLSVDHPGPRIGSSVKVTVKVTNNGTEKLSGIKVRFTYQGKHQDKSIGTIKGGKTGRITTTITAKGTLGTQSITVKVNPTKTIKESNYANNTKQINIRVKAKEQPDIISAVPATLKKGTTTTVTLRLSHVPSSARFDFGEGISLVSSNSYSTTTRTLKVKLKVDSGCSTGRHGIQIKAGRWKYTATAALQVVPGAQLQMTGIIPADQVGSPFSVISLQPDRWTQGKQYTVTLIGTGLDLVTSFDFGEGIEVESFDLINPSMIDIEIKVDDHAVIGHRSVKVIADSTAICDGWVVVQPVQTEGSPTIQYDPGLFDFLPEGIHLLEPEYDATDEDPEIPQVTEKTEFIWKEFTPNTADTFEFRIVNSDGTPLYKKQQAATGPNPCQFFYSDMQFLIELYEALQGEQQAQITTSSSSGVTSTTSATSEDENQREETVIYWEVHGYLQGELIEGSDRWPLLLGGEGPTGTMCDPTNTVLQALHGDEDEEESNSSDTDGLTFYPGDTVEIYGEFTLANCPWSISASPYGSSTSGGASGALDTPSYYDNPWETNVNPVSSITSDSLIGAQSGSTSHLMKGPAVTLPSFDTAGYEFNNVFIDWGDGTSETITAGLVNTKDCTFIPQNHSFTDLMKLSMQHSYSNSGSYSVRIYVIPIDDMGSASAIAALNNSSTAKYVPIDPASFRERILLASLTSNSGQSDGTISSAISASGSVIRPGEQESSRVYQVYCNPLDVHIVQDPDATGPLQLKSITLLEFSSESQAESSSSASQEMSAVQGSSSFTTSPAAQFQQTADTTVYSCDIGLWTDAKLTYVGQGYIQLDWYLNGVILESSQEKVGPSELRTDLTSDTSSWPEPIDSTVTFPSPQFPVEEMGRHTLKAVAKVIEDPTLSSTDSVSISSSLAGSSAVLPTSGSTLKTSFLSGSSSLSTIYQSNSITSQMSMNPPYRVVSAPKSYLVAQADEGTICQFHFPVADGSYFSVGSLSNLTSNGANSYSGSGVFLFNLPDSTSSVKEYFVPITFQNWTIDEDGMTVVSGSLDTVANKQLGHIGGINAQLSRLSGQATDRVDATFDLEIADTTLMVATSASAAVQKWSAVSAPLTPAGDWYSPTQTLEQTKIGWSLVKIQSSNAHIDLSLTEGEKACQGKQPSGSGVDWIGIHLGNAKVYPYTFHMEEQIINAPDWGIVSSGICGHAHSDTAFDVPFGKAGGSRGWESIDIWADKGVVTSEYGHFFVQLTWPTVRLFGDKVSLQYDGQTGGPQIDLSDVKADGAVEEPYGAVDLSCDIRSFKQSGKTWGINTDTTFAFHNNQGDEFDLTVPDLFFTIDNVAEYEGGILQLNQNNKIGGADIYLTTSTVSGGTRSMVFTHKATLKLGQPLNESETSLSYSIFGQSGETMTSSGPQVGQLLEDIRFEFDGGGRDGLQTSTITGLTYNNSASGGGQVASYGYPLRLASSSSTSSDGWPDLDSQILLAGLMGANGNGICSQDTFGGIVTTDLFGTYEASMTFRYGRLGNEPYWMTQASLSGIDILVYTDVFLHAFYGGVGKNFSAEAIRNGGCDGVPQQTGGLILSAGIDLTAVSEPTLLGSGSLTLDLGQESVSIGLEGINLLGMDSGLSGEFTFKSDRFTGSIIGDKKFLDGNVKIFGDAEIYLGEDDWHIHIGTDTAPVNGSAFDLIKGTSYLMVGKAQADFNIDVGYHLSTRKVLRCSISSDLTLGGNLNFTYEEPFSFAGTASTRSEMTFKNPIKDLSIGTGLDFTIGCCSPKILTATWSHSSCPPLKGGFGVTILPSLSFHPWFKACLY